MIVSNKYSIIIYIDHETLKSIFVTNQIEKSRIIIWLNRFEKFETKLFHRLSKNQYIKLTNGLNKISTRLISINIINIIEKLTIFVLIIEKIQKRNYSIIINIFNNFDKYKRFSIYYHFIEYMQKDETKMNELKIL